MGGIEIYEKKLSILMKVGSEPPVVVLFLSSRHRLAFQHMSFRVIFTSFF